MSMPEPEPEIHEASADLAGSSELSATGEFDSLPDPRSIWVFDHMVECGNLIRMMYIGLAEFIKKSRGECPTCMQTLPDPRPATAEDW